MNVGLATALSIESPLNEISTPTRSPPSLLLLLLLLLFFLFLLLLLFPSLPHIDKQNGAAARAVL